MIRTSRPIKLAVVILLLAIVACNLPSRQNAGQDVATRTPNIQVITATPFLSPTPTLEAATVDPLTGITTTPTTGSAQAAPQQAVASATPSPSPTPMTSTDPTAAPTALPPTPTPLPEDGPLYSARLGINFISSAQHQTTEARFKAGIDTGAGWDRFAIYWNEIETSQDKYEWSLYDDTIQKDVTYGLRTDAILLGSPTFFRDNRGVPKNIYEPVFSDGSDSPGSGKTINPNNPWAEFVYAIAMRYKPGGELAKKNSWQNWQGVRVWEIWNEPDLNNFWEGSVDEYARLVKVAYLAIEQADPDARVMIGGLVLYNKLNFLPDLLNIYQKQGFYPFDIVAVHAYSWPPYSFDTVLTIENLLALHGLGDTPVWLNESGVTVWDDYPGPNWAQRNDQIVGRATMQEQAAYVIQSAAYAYMAGADVVFHFQLYDDCGNQAQGSTFAPHDGSLCAGGAVCWGDALGLVRNGSDNSCFNQHPQANTVRPSYEAFHTVGQVFAGQNFVPLTAYTSGPERRLVFARPDSAEIITVIWNEKGQPAEAVLKARSGQAILITQGGATATVKPDDDGAYHITLSPATNQNQVNLPGVEYMIGGAPAILIEQTPKPLVSVLPMLDFSNTALLVKWRSSDPKITKFEIWYRDVTSGGEWQLWISPEGQGEAFFTAGQGRTYSFFARGQLADGSWTEETPSVQAWTTIQ